jgi:hypothetical protein
VQGTTWPKKAAAELLLILRSRFNEEEILKSHVFLQWTGFQNQNLDRNVATTVKKAIDRAIDSLPEDQRKPLLLMTGRDPKTSGSRITRGKILDEMSHVIPRQRNTQSATPLDQRQVLFIEEKEYVPAVLRAMTSTSKLESVYADATVRISISEGRGPGTLRMSVELSASVASTYWIVGVTPDELVADQICAMTGLVNEMICPGPSRHSAESVAFTLAVHDSVRRKVRPSQIKMERKTAVELADLVSREDLAAFTDVDWYIGAIPKSDDQDPVRVTFTNSQDIDYRARYCYWSAGRRMFVHSISIDARAFPHADDHHFSLQPFLMLHTNTSGLEGSGNWELSIDSWIEPGNGVAFVWGDSRDIRE